MKQEPAATSAAEIWERAYQRFETPMEEIRKFKRRLRKLGVQGWDRKAHAVELFCGRGNGLNALSQFGFTHIEGVDLSPTLAAKYQGIGQIHVGDCRQLPFPNCSKDILIAQGGLHHLPTLPEDLEKTLAEANRVLRPGGRFVTVEPWLTPFLRLAHAVCSNRVVRGVSGKLDAMQVMIELEGDTYVRWLESPQLILDCLHQQFEPEREFFAWGKLMFVGRKR